MNTHPLHESAIIIKGVGIGAVTRGMVRVRAAELAMINGRPAHEVSKADWEDAKRELTQGCDLEPNQVLLESAPESERWDPIHGSTGSESPASFNDGEDEEGRDDCDTSKGNPKKGDNHHLEKGQAA